MWRRLGDDVEDVGGGWDVEDAEDVEDVGGGCGGCGGMWRMVEDIR